MGGETPLVFAEQAIRRLVTNQLGEETLVLPNDYQIIRIVFRKRGGCWEGVTHGDDIQIRLLGSVVKAWANLRGKRQKVEER